MKIIINITHSDKNTCPYCTYQGTITFQNNEGNNTFNLQFENAVVLRPLSSTNWNNPYYNIRLTYEILQFLKENKIDPERIKYLFPSHILKGQIGSIEAELDETSFLYSTIINNTFNENSTNSN